MEIRWSIGPASSPPPPTAGSTPPERWLGGVDVGHQHKPCNPVPILTVMPWLGATERSEPALVAGVMKSVAERVYPGR